MGSVSEKTVAVTGKTTGLGYIKTLDGWRAIAVLGVMAYHGRPLDTGQPLSRVLELGEHGVQLFFAISGILICSRLLEEQRLHGNISLRGFYIRRVFRIQPAAVLFLASIAVLGVAGILHPSLPATLSALFCFRNYYATTHAFSRPDDIYTAHFWSLSVEEHFYLFLPALMVLARRRLLPVMGALTAASVVWSMVGAHLTGAGEANVHWRTDISLPSLLVPALLALLLTRPAFRERMSNLTRHNFVLFLSVAAIVVLKMRFHGHMLLPVMFLGFPLMVITTVLHPEGWLGRLLESRPFVYVGRLSYSLYLWQQLFILREAGSSPLGALQRLPWGIAAVFAAAMLSFYLVERPLMRLGHRMAPPATAGRPDLQVARGPEPTRA